MDDILTFVDKYFEDCKNGHTNLISPEGLVKLLENKETPFILDIRSKEDYEKGHIDGAYNIFWHELGEFVDVLPKDEKVIVVCYTGQSAGQVVVILKMLGFDAYSLRGGMNNGWLTGSFPVKAGCG